ncbi:hypothetical protein F5X68DRAFT_276446 [Plectosphaerella plurivora]|uniref:Uncharacterized protein n=1 Tax=Plectosphaerella plurivora TaxID=936078 RepID=A0A9P8VAZ7_9PEZI|nr:hypothetical protein F5X68DRAFT_276446 [Plectosphaerella plurivora]
MGAYVSTQECRRQFKIEVDCSFDFNSTTAKNHIGSHKHGEVPADPDVAGIGIIFMFVAVTSLALLVSLADLAWRFFKLKWPHLAPAPNLHEKGQTLYRTWGTFSLSELFETVILSCSDQQVFTGGAYAISLRYWKSCTITAYHYNVIAKMLLLTCATHLMSIAIVRYYWRYKFLALVRVLVVIGVFIVTGLLLANQNATQEIPFPTSVPPLTEINSPILMLAACFQDDESPFVRTITDSFKDRENAEQAFLYARPGNKVEGWNLYLFILFCYGLSCLAEFGHMIVRSEKRKRFFHKRLGIKRGPSSKFGARFRRYAKYVFGVYLVACIALGCVTIIMQTIQIFRMRKWVRNSGWLENENGKTDEDEWSSFGQLVPMFLGLLIVFKVFEEICRLTSPARNEQQ